MKKLILLFSLVFGLCLPAFAQPGGQIVRTIPLALPYGPLVSVANSAPGSVWCSPDLSTYPFTSHVFTYMFPTGTPNAVTLTVTGSTNGRTFSSVTTASTTTGGSISFSGIYTGLCITATTMTGSGVTVAGSYVGVAAGSGGSITGTVDPTTPASWALGIEDAAETPGGYLSMAGAVIRTACGAGSGSTDGDNATLNVDTAGLLCTAGQNYVLSVVPGTGATNLGKAIDTATGATDTGVLFLGTRTDTLSTLTPANGDNVQARFSSTGALWTTSAIIDAAEGAAVASSPVPMGCVYRSSVGTLDTGDVGYPLCDTGGRFVIAGTVIEDAAETAANYLVGIGAVVRTTPAGSTATNGDNATFNVSGNGALWTSNIPNTTGGWDSLNATAADGATACTSTVQAIKASAGTFGGYFINNPNTADSWLHIYNVASGSVTVGTTAPALTFRIPGAAANSVAANLEISNGVNFSTAMSMACTTTAAGNGNPSVALESDILYK